MTISKIGANNPLTLRANKSIYFGSEENAKETKTSPDTLETTKPKRSLTAKKWGAGLAGPFAGNLVNGRTGKAFAYLGITSALGAIAGITAEASRPISVISALALLTTYIVGVVGVVKNVKPDQE